jgi:2-oxoglutarate ferredoxin oxidoreductase subunit beta
MTAIAHAAEKGEVLTGLLYVSSDAEDCHRHLNTYDARPFNQLAERDLCPDAGMLGKINAALR